jgi:hypothetical protein
MDRRDWELLDMQMKRFQPPSAREGVMIAVLRSLSRGRDRRQRVFIWKPFFGTNTVRGWKDDLGLFSEQRPKSNAVKDSKLPNAAPATRADSLGEKPSVVVPTLAEPGGYFAPP